MQDEHKYYSFVFQPTVPNVFEERVIILLEALGLDGINCYNCYSYRSQ